MVTVKLPYGAGYREAELDKNNLKGIFNPRPFTPEVGAETLVENALKRPVGTPPLRELAVGKKKVVIISSDHTRPLPSHITMPLLLGEIRAGNEYAEIHILVATGSHRPPSKDELAAKYGEQIVAEERITSHDCHNNQDLSLAGRLPSGQQLYLNRLALTADLLLAEGFIEPHFMAGFSGGPKSILPGIAGLTSILSNHSSQFVRHPRARTGILTGNPIYRDISEAAHLAGLDFILNVALDSQKKIIAAFGGGFREVHREGCAFVEKLVRITPPRADIVITSNGGYPLDQNIYQAVKSMDMAARVCREDGIIIVVAQCREGHGGESFFNTFAQSPSLVQIRRDIEARPPEETVPDQWESQILARVLIKHRVIMVTDAPRTMVEAMYMKKATTISEALVMAEKLLTRKNHDIIVIPDGVGVIV